MAKKEITVKKDEKIDVVKDETVKVETPIEKVKDETPAVVIPVKAPDEAVNNEDKIEADVLDTKYVLDEAKIDAYLRQGKRFDIITQRKKGGPFVGRGGEVYIPLSLIKK